MEGRFELFKKDGVWCIRLILPRWVISELWNCTFKVASASFLANGDEQHPTPLLLQHWDDEKMRFHLKSKRKLEKRKKAQDAANDDGAR